MVDETFKKDMVRHKDEISVTVLFIIIIINCIYVPPIQNISFYGALHKTKLYNKFPNK